jgi:hypothetical protein
MFKLIFSFVLLVSAAGNVAQADASNPLFPVCIGSARADSFGRGIRDEVMRTHLGLTFEWANVQCYELGREYAVKTMAAEGGPNALDCKSSFESGFEWGMKASSVSAGTGCFNLGHMAGLSELRIAAANGDVKVCGRECRKYYCKGMKNWAEDVSEHWLPAGLDEKLQACYHHGYHDAIDVRVNNCI